MTLYENGELSPLLFLLASALKQSDEHRKKTLLLNLHKRNCKRLKSLIESDENVSASKKELSRLLGFAVNAWKYNSMCLVAAEYLFDDNKLYKAQGDALFYVESQLYVAEVKTWDGPINDMCKVKKAIDQTINNAKRLKSFIQHLSVVEPSYRSEMKSLTTLHLECAVILPLSGEQQSGTIMYMVENEILSKEVVRFEPLT